MSGNQDTKTPPDAEANAQGLAEIAAKLAELGYPVPEGADIGAATVTVLQLMSDATAPGGGDQQGEGTADATANAQGLADIAAKLAELDYAMPEGAEIGATACTVLQLLFDAVTRSAGELAAAKREAATWKGQATRARTEKQAALAELAERDPAARARRLPDALPAPDAGALMAAIAVAGQVEIVAFIDGIEELRIAPCRMRGNVFRQAGGGLCLDLPFEAIGPATVDCWALYLDGELAIARRRDGGQLTMGAGQMHNLGPDVIF
ncbi:hypothetical protein [Novosphingobium colocasiae]|uniref:hypothetical protein n=1 Tax=Novosphingobium colocasiae TaxID=1256513 RepID=UPI0035B31A8B